MSGSCFFSLISTFLRDLFSCLPSTEGFKEAAEKFQEEANLPAPAEIHDMENRIRIRDCIQAGQIGQAISQVHNLHPELLDDDRYLFFHLQVRSISLSVSNRSEEIYTSSFSLSLSPKQQQLIELIREQRVEEALRFATDQLAERGEEDPGILEELERTMALLAFQDPNQSPFSDLLSDSHRQKVRKLTRDPAFPPTQYLLHLCIFSLGCQRTQCRFVEGGARRLHPASSGLRSQDASLVPGRAGQERGRLPEDVRPRDGRDEGVEVIFGVIPFGGILAPGATLT